MAYGPGKYDDLATLVRRKALAQAVVLVVGVGKRGSGFSVQVGAVSPAHAAELTLGLAQLLRDAADQMERDAQGMVQAAAPGTWDEEAAKVSASDDEEPVP